MNQSVTGISLLAIVVFPLFGLAGCGHDATLSSGSARSLAGESGSLTLEITGMT